MSRRPSLKAIEKEAKALLPVISRMVPIAYRVRNVTAVKVIDAGKAQVHFDDAADGGRCVDLEISQEDMDSENWRLRVLTRMVHEFMHVRSADHYEAVLRTVGTKHEKIVCNLWEAGCEAAEGIVLWAVQNGAKI
jgi:hypothetical protein